MRPQWPPNRTAGMRRSTWSYCGPSAAAIRPTRPTCRTSEGRVGKSPIDGGGSEPENQPMTVSATYRAFVLEQLSRALPDVRARSMFGGVGIYCGPVFFALIGNDVLLFQGRRPDTEAFRSQGDAAVSSFRRRRGGHAVLRGARRGARRARGACRVG
ncbi:TfoX/Sxy family protein [Gemmatimonas sp.]|uniref:TfoX/Sxy family protein n=1 Tax=Gemmatimonas sp. TaxID=1962908 RepID=UPI003DA42A6C